MNRILLPLCLLVAGGALAADPPRPAAPSTHPHTVVKAAATEWGPAPPVLPPGAQAAVLYGDPGKAGAFALRLKAPAGYRVPRHWHPADEQVTVIEGDLSLSMGEKATAESGSFTQGDYVNLPARMQHEATTRNGMVVEIHSDGPFQIHYIDPADDPTKQTAPAAEQ